MLKPHVTPVFRIFDVPKALEFYVGFLGYEEKWRHQYEPDLPVYMGLARDGVFLHLSEHFGDGSPLLQPVGIGHRRPHLGVDVDDEADPLRLGRRPHDVRRRVDDPRDLRLSHRQAELAAHDARHVHEVVDEPRLRPRVPLDDGETTLELCRVSRVGEEDLRPAEHRRSTCCSVSDGRCRS